MSLIEDLLMEAWKLGIKDQVMKKVSNETAKLHSEGKRHIDRESIYENAFKEAMSEIDKNDGRNR